jgi:hypothetical protein
METISAAPVILTGEERDVLLELLDRERSNLPVEIRHTRTARFRDVLKHRLDIVTDLANRLGGEGPYGH